MLERCECLCFDDVFCLVASHAELAVKLPHLDVAGLDAAIAALAADAMPACRGPIYDELFAPCRSAQRLSAAAGDVPLLCGVPALQAVQAAAYAAWTRHGVSAPRVLSGGWSGDLLDGECFVRHVAPLSAALAAADVTLRGSSEHGAVMLAWLERSASGGWMLTDATCSLEAAPEGLTLPAPGAKEWAHQGMCVLLRRGYVIAEGVASAHRAGGLPLRLYAAFHVSDVVHLAALDVAVRAPASAAPSFAAAAMGIEPLPSLLLMPAAEVPSAANSKSVCTFMRWYADCSACPESIPPGVVLQVCVRGRVVAECMRSRPHIQGPLHHGMPDAEQRTERNSRLRLRDVTGRDNIDIFIDDHRRRLPPGARRSKLFLPCT